jgi:hypothetical protein
MAIDYVGKCPRYVLWNRFSFLKTHNLTIARSGVCFSCMLKLALIIPDLERWMLLLLLEHPQTSNEFDFCIENTD